MDSLEMVSHSLVPEVQIGAQHVAYTYVVATYLRSSLAYPYWQVGQGLQHKLIYMVSKW